MAYVTPSPPLVQARFRLLADGLPDGYCTMVKVPQAKQKPTEVQPGNVPQPLKFVSGLAEYEELEAKFILDEGGAISAWVYAWLSETHNPVTGQTTSTPVDAKRDITVQLLTANGTTVAEEYLCVGCNLLEPGSIDLEGGKEDAVEREVKFTVDYVQKVI